MAEEEVTTTEQEQPIEEPHGTDWKAEARKWEQRAKENKGAADELQALKDSSEKLRKSLAKAEAERDALVSEKERTAIVDEISAKYGVPKDILRGDSAEDIESHAKAIRELLDSQPKYPHLTDNGEATTPNVGETSKADALGKFIQENFSS